MIVTPKNLRQRILLDNESITKIVNARNISEFHKIAGSRHIVSRNPLFMTVVMDISNKCNLRCRMCYFSHNDYFKAAPVYMTPETFENIVADLLPHTTTLTLSCGSEPLTSPHFIDILKIASQYRVPHLAFATNGILLTEEKADAVIRYGVTNLMLSIESPTKETFEYIRRGAKFDQFLQNIEYLAKRKEELKSYTPVLRFNVTLMRSNIEEVEKLVDLAAEMKVSHLDFRHAVIHEGLGIEKESLVHYPELSDFWLDKARERAKKLGLTILAIPEKFEGRQEDQRPRIRILSRDRMKKYRNILTRNPRYFMSSTYIRFKELFENAIGAGSKRNPVYCGLPFDYTLINAGGHIVPCPHCHGVSAYGTLSTDVRFEDVWFNGKFKELRENILTNQPPDMCKVCSNIGMYHLHEDILSISGNA